MPSSPMATASTSGESGTIVMITSASRTASATGFAPPPPASTSAATLSGLRLWPTTSKPASTRLAAIGPPMIPRPMKATVVMRSAPLLSLVRQGCRRSALLGRRAPGAGQPVEGVGTGAAGLVLEPDPAVVAGGGDAVEPGVDRELPGARLVAAGGVGDLHVPDPARRAAGCAARRAAGCAA